MTHHAGQLKSATDVIKNVSYQTLLSAAQETVKAVKCRCNPTQHFIRGSSHKFIEILIRC